MASLNISSVLVIISVEETVADLKALVMVTTTTPIFTVSCDIKVYDGRRFHGSFVAAVDTCGGPMTATGGAVLTAMGSAGAGLTTEQVAGHLKEYRKKVTAEVQKIWKKQHAAAFDKALPECGGLVAATSKAVHEKMQQNGFSDLTLGHVDCQLSERKKAAGIKRDNAALAAAVVAAQPSAAHAPQSRIENRGIWKIGTQWKTEFDKAVAILDEGGHKLTAAKIRTRMLKELRAENAPTTTQVSDHLRSLKRAKAAPKPVATTAGPRVEQPTAIID